MVRLRVHLLGERINRSDSGRRDAYFLQRHLGGVKGIDAVGKREFPDGKLGCVHRDIRLERCLVAADGKCSCTPTLVKVSGDVVERTVLCFPIITFEESRCLRD